MPQFLLISSAASVQCRFNECHPLGTFRQQSATCDASDRGKTTAKRRHFDAAEHSLRQHLTKIGRAKVSEARRVHARSCAVSITLPNHATGRSHHSVPECKEGKLGSQTTDLLLGLLDIATLFAILFRLSSTFTLIANTQRELRRAVYRLDERRRYADLSIGARERW